MLTTLTIKIAKNVLILCAAVTRRLPSFLPMRRGTIEQTKIGGRDKVLARSENGPSWTLFPAFASFKAHGSTHAALCALVYARHP